MTLIKMSVEPRFLRIPTRWEIRRVPQGSFFTRLEFAVRPPKPSRAKNAVSVALPFFSENVEELSLVALDGWELRNRFFQMKQTEEAALAFLEEVGVWGITPDDHVTGSDEGALSGVFGSRFVRGWATPVALSDMWETQHNYRKFLANPGEMRRRYGPPPPRAAGLNDRAAFGLTTSFENTLLCHVEWRGGHPVGVVETITWHEIMMAATQMDLLQGARFRLCRRPDCHIPFPITTAHRKLYCSWYCAHIEHVRRSRKEKRKRDPKIATHRPIG